MYPTNTIFRLCLTLRSERMIRDFPTLIRAVLALLAFADKQIFFFKKRFYLLFYHDLNNLNKKNEMCRFAMK